MGKEGPSEKSRPVRAASAPPMAGSIDYRSWTIVPSSHVSCEKMSAFSGGTSLNGSSGRLKSSVVGSAGENQIKRLKAMITN